MANNPLYISPDGFEKLKTELATLKTVTRKELAERIERAKELGDLRENADYQQGKEDLAFVEGRILELEAAVQRAQIISSPASGGDTVTIGATVVITTAQGKEKTYTIVGATEADPLVGRISNESPIGQALLGKQVGDQAAFQAPAGMVTYTVSKII